MLTHDRNGFAYNNGKFYTKTIKFRINKKEAAQFKIFIHLHQITTITSSKGSFFLEMFTFTTNCNQNVTKI
jgi:hypothetical protein